MFAGAFRGDVAEGGWGLGGPSAFAKSVDEKERVADILQLLRIGLRIGRASDLAVYLDPVLDMLLLLQLAQLCSDRCLSDGRVWPETASDLLYDIIWYSPGSHCPLRQSLVEVVLSPIQ